MTPSPFRSRLLQSMWRLVATLWLVLLAACGGSGDDTRASTQTTDLLGWAHASGPLVGARVRVLASDGRELAAATHPTHVTGSWHVRVRGLPASYTVEVSGGQDGGQPFAGTLLHVEQGTDPSEPIAVNIATTLAARVRALNPKLTDQAAADAVRRHLQLPAHVELQRHLRRSDVYFSGAVFLASVPQGTHFDAHLEALAQQVGVVAGTSYVDAARLATGGALGPRRSRLAGDTSLSANEAGADASQVLLAGAVGGPDAAGMALGNILISKVFGGGGDGLANALQAIYNKLQDINKRIDSLQQSLDRLEQSVATNAYNAGVASLQDLQDDLDAVWPRYEALLHVNTDDDVASAAARASFLSKMAESLSGPGSYPRAYRMREYMEKAPSRLMGDRGDLAGAGGAGILHLWNQVILGDKKSGLKRFVSTADQVKLPQAHSYWQMKQAQLFILLKEYAVAAADPAAYQLPSSLLDRAFFDAYWNTQFLPSRSTAGELQPSKAFQQQSAAADHVADVTPLPTGFIYDRALEIVWAVDVSSYPAARRQVVTRYGTWNAVGYVDDGDGLWEFSPKAFAALEDLSQLHGWTYPSAEQLQSLLKPAYAFNYPTGGAADKMRFLKGQGFGAWITNESWDQWTYASDSVVTVVPNHFVPDGLTFRVRDIVSLDTGERHTSCDDVGDPHHCNTFGDDPWRLTPGGFLAVHTPAAGRRYAPEGW